jgi:uncharacterized protein (TIGR03067 family)
MRTGMLIGGVLVLALGAQAQEAKTDLQQLQGTWLGSLVRSGGDDATDEEKKFRVKLVIAGDRYRAFAEEQMLMEGTIRLDASRQPPMIDATFATGEFKGAVQKGIYALQGDDLIVTFAKPGDERPRDFQTRAGTEEATVRYQRDKK